MDTPFFSPASLTGMVLGGAQATLFAMGVYNPCGHPLAPTVKVCGNPTTVRSWGESIDVDLSCAREASSTDHAVRLLDALKTAVSGIATAAERDREGVFSIPLAREPL